MTKPKTVAKFGKFVIASRKELWGELQVAGKNSLLYVRDDLRLSGRTDMYRMLLILCLALTAVPVASAGQIKTTEELIRAMQKKYAESWYKTATFVQKTTEFQKDGTKKVSTWYEALSVPGGLRVDFTPVKEGNGILFTNRTIYSFKDGKAENPRPFVHPLMILGFDVYKLPLADVVETLGK